MTVDRGLSFLAAVVRLLVFASQDVVRLVANSGRDPHLHAKKVLVHSLVQLDIDW